MNRLRQRPLLSFFVLTYLISWGFWIPMSVTGSAGGPFQIIGTFGPALAAVITSLAFGGWDRLTSLLKRLLIWRVHVGWYVFSFFSTAAFALVAVEIYQLLGNRGLEFNDPSRWYLAIPAFFYVLIFSVLGEEIGWRGYALPRLQSRWSGLSSSIILGLIWGLWHLPLFWTSGNFHQDIPIPLFLLQIVGFSVIYTWMFNNTEGSLLLAHLFHAASNTTLGILPILPVDTGGDLFPLWLAVGLLWTFSLTIIAIAGPRSLARDREKVRIPEK